jgi:hypothetical protein
MRFYKRAAFIVEKELKMIHKFEITESISADGMVETRPFKEPAGPLRDPVWHHGVFFVVISL